MNNQNLSAMIDTWLQFTLDNPLYVAIIATTVFILTALLFSLKTLGLNKKLKLSEAARLSNEKTLSNTTQQLKDSQAQLDIFTNQIGELQSTLNTEKQRALELAQHINDRNDKITATVEKFATHFDTIERPAISADFKAEQLWQQHDKVVEQLISNLKTVQHAKSELENTLHQEKTKLTDIEARLNSLQSQLDNQTNLVTTLQAQNTSLHQQHEQSQQALTETLQQLDQLKNATPVQVETPKPAVDDNAEKLKNLFKKPTSKPEPIAPIIETKPVEIKPEPVTETPVIQAKPELETVTSEPQAEGSTEWYQKIISQSETAPEIKPTPTTPTPSTPEEPEKTGMVKGLYQKFNTKTETQQPAPKPEKQETKGFKSVFNTKKTEVVEEEDSGIENMADKLTEKFEKTGIIKSLYQKFSSKEEEEQEQPVPNITVKPTKEETKNTGFKSVFNNKKTEVVEKDDDEGLENMADKLTEKLEKFTRFFSKKDED